MTKYVVNGKEYDHVESAEELLERVKNSNSNTEKMDLKGYIKHVALDALKGVLEINYEITDENISQASEEILEAWLNEGDAEELPGSELEFDEPEFDVDSVEKFSSSDKKHPSSRVNR